MPNFGLYLSNLLQEPYPNNMTDENNKLNRYIVQITLTGFLLIVIGIFVENIKYFSTTLLNTFAEPKKLESLSVNIDGLKNILQKINIDESAIQLIKK